MWPVDGEWYDFRYLVIRTWYFFRFLFRSFVGGVGYELPLEGVVENLLDVGGDGVDYRRLHAFEAFVEVGGEIVMFDFVGF